MTTSHWQACQVFRNSCDLACHRSPLVSFTIRPHFPFPLFFHLFALPNSLASRARSDPLRCVWFVSILLRARATTGCWAGEAFQAIGIRGSKPLASRLTAHRCFLRTHKHSASTRNQVFFGQRAVVDQVRSASLKESPRYSASDHILHNHQGPD
jgi:hypothetical protein